MNHKFLNTLKRKLYSEIRQTIDEIKSDYESREIKCVEGVIEYKWDGEYSIHHKYKTVVSAERKEDY